MSTVITPWLVWSALLDYTDSRSLHLFSSTNLQERQWRPLGAFQMPSGTNACAFTVMTNDVDSAALPFFLDSFNGIGFYRFAADFDTDGDGGSDGDEITQSSDPADATDGGMPGSRIAVPFTFGDYSGSRSEKYRLEVKPVAGVGAMPSGYVWLNENYGQCETKTAMLKAERHQIAPFLEVCVHSSLAVSTTLNSTLQMVCGRPQPAWSQMQQLRKRYHRISGT